jgi:hypothetical protein
VSRFLAYILPDRDSIEIMNLHWARERDPPAAVGLFSRGCCKG